MTHDETTILPDLLDNAARRWPHHPALTSKSRTVSYLQLATIRDDLARWLSRSGIGHGDRVILHADAPITAAALVFAAARVGAVFILLNDQVRGTNFAHILDDSEPALLISDSEPARAAASARAITAVAVPDPAMMPRPARIQSDAAVSGYSERPALSVDIACLIYTSGTTALPKAVVSTHTQMLFAIDAIARVLDYHSDDVIFSPLPLSFDYGLYQLFLAATCGAHVWLATATDAGPPLLRTLTRSGATILAAVPSVAEALAKLVRRSGPGELRLRKLTNTGAAMPAPVLQTLRAALPDLRVQLMFGLTECKRATIMPEDGDLARPGSSGRAIPGTEAYAVDEHGHRLPAGEIGQIVVRGPHVMAGYWRRTEETARRFPRTHGLLPQLHTGDYGWFDEQGYLYFSGRRDELYKSHGFRVSTTEVEAAARRVPGIEAAAVLAPSGGEPARLFYIGAIDPGAVQLAMRADIEEFKVPQVCVPVAALPLTANGKIDRAQLSDLTEEIAHVAGR